MVSTRAPGEKPLRAELRADKLNPRMASWTESNPDHIDGMGVLLPLRQTCSLNAKTKQHAIYGVALNAPVHEMM